ncbi:MAG: adenylosuccinate synthetase, partial [Campylobacterales bacterium]|nr:adenylosuccinate synthetase [Campylobacterales bacterium]
GRGIGPSYSDKISRSGHRIGELKDTNKLCEKIFEYFEQNSSYFKALDINLPNKNELLFELELYAKKLKPFIVDTTKLTWELLEKNEKLLLEGAQGTMLDIDHGTYPFVTSSNTIAAGACSGIGLSPKSVGNVTGIAKAYCTRVGNGPFPTEDFSGEGDILRTNGHEFGTTTGRARRCGWFDAIATKYACKLNGCDDLAIMKLDVLDGFEKIKVCVGYEYFGEKIDFVPFDLENVTPIYKEFDGWNGSKGVREFDKLPQNAKDYVLELEKLVDTKIGLISTSPDREDTIFMK